MQGLIIRTCGKINDVLLTDNRLVVCTLAGTLRQDDFNSTNPIAVGDNVAVDDQTITTILPRKNYLVRRATNLSKQYQILAANIDEVLLFVSLKSPKTPTVFIDRCLCMCEAYNIPASIYFCKTDCYDRTERLCTEMHDLVGTYKRINYPCYCGSLRTNPSAQVTHFNDVLNGKRVVLLGLSGTGKSTFINALAGEKIAREGELSKYYDAGCHTTTFAQLYQLPNCQLIDLPGVRGFGLVDIAPRELDHYFPEIFEQSKRCRYDDCMHFPDDDGCAVRQALKDDRISRSRYASYLQMLEEEKKYRRTE